MVSTHSHPKVAGQAEAQADWKKMFQHTATRRWLEFNKLDEIVHYVFQHTATRRWLEFNKLDEIVHYVFQHTATRRWLAEAKINQVAAWEFQHTATRRWLVPDIAPLSFSSLVSTHSHPKVAGDENDEDLLDFGVSTHSHPKVAG